MFSILMNCGPDLPPPAEATATATPAVTETPTPTPTPAPAAFGDPRPSAGAFFYGRDTCGPKQVTVDVQLMGGDPEVGPYDALMFFRLAEMNGPGRTEWSAMAMNPTGDDMFTETLDSQSDIPGFNMWVSSWLQVQFVAEDAQGVEIARSPVFPMLSELARCPR